MTNVTGPVQQLAIIATDCGCCMSPGTPVCPVAALSTLHDRVPTSWPQPVAAAGAPCHAVLVSDSAGALPQPEWSRCWETPPLVEELQHRIQTGVAVNTAVGQQQRRASHSGYIHWPKSPKEFDVRTILSPSLPMMVHPKCCSMSPTCRSLDICCSHSTAKQ